MRRLLERTFDIGASADRAWAELVAAEQWPRWARHLASVQVTPPGPVGPASSATLKLTNHTKATMRVTEFEDGRRFRWEGSFLWLGLGYDHLVTTDDTDQAQITFTVEGAGVGVNSIGRLFAGLLRPQPRPRHPPTAGPASITRPGTTQPGSQQATR